MAIIAIPYPLLQGVRFDHSSLDIKLSGVSNLGVKALDWSDEMAPGEAYGTSAQMLGITRGQYKAAGSLELWKAESVNFEQQLSTQFPNVGLLEMRWDIDVIYNTEGGFPTFTASLRACRIVKRADQTSAGNEPHSKKYDLFIAYVIENGVNPITGLRK